MWQKKQYYTINEPDKLIEFINGELKPKELEKKNNGEVFTPIPVVEDMLNNLEEGYIKEHKKSIFSESQLKWFDPAVGIGNFPIIVYQRLMEGLKQVIKDNEERRKHILEKMLYMSELTSKNVFICKKIFCGDSYKINLYEGDSLKIDINQIWGIDKFDVIMGNPPYNSNGIKHIGNKNIYVYFVKKGLELLKNTGYLLYIHPPVYRIPNHKIHHTKINLNEIYTTKRIICIKMFSINETHKLMSVMMNVDFIIIKNVDNDRKYVSKIIDINKNEYNQEILPNDFIPNYGLNIMEKIKNKNSFGNIVLHLDSEMHAQMTKGNKYKNIHGITSKGIKIRMSDKKHKYYDSPKLIINGIGSYNYVFHDKKGEYGITQSPICIINPSNNTIFFIQSKLFHYIANSTKIIGNNFNIKTSIFLPIIPDNIKISNDDDLYNYFNFTLNEKMKISMIKIPKYENKELTSNTNNTDEKCEGVINTNTIP